MANSKWYNTLDEEEKKTFSPYTAMRFTSNVQGQKAFKEHYILSVNEFARNYFDGGGHTNAAGGRSEVSLEETVTRFKSLLPNYKTQLLESYNEN